MNEIQKKQNEYIRQRIVEFCDYYKSIEPSVLEKMTTESVVKAFPMFNKGYEIKDLKINNTMKSKVDELIELFNEAHTHLPKYLMSSKTLFGYELITVAFGYLFKGKHIHAFDMLKNYKETEYYKWCRKTTHRNSKGNDLIIIY